ncbi:MAG TPA: hypothetical protein VHF47_09195 [Acidimicrobiales bacterium]|nr:hypothetical protein [Acidimicrobiales bacterium]
MDAATLRPLGIGETLDVAIKVYRARFGTLVKTVGVVVAPVFVLGALVQLSLLPDSEDDVVQTDPVTGEITTVDASEVWTIVAGFILLAFLTYLAAQLATAAAFKIIGASYLGEEVEWRDSLRFAFGRLRSLVWLSILTGLGLLLGFLACILPGIYLYGAWSVAVPALVLEDARGRAALGRSRRLVQGRWWPVFGVVVLSWLLTTIVSGALGGLLGGIVAFGDNDTVAAFADAVAQAAASMLTTPFAAAVATVLYFDLRVRKEGFDLELLARNVGVEPPADFRATAPPPTPESDADQPPFWPPPPGWRPPDA